MLSWLLLAGLGIIWAVFLIPTRRRSPSASVEEFENKMSLLKEANGISAGRWVLTPRRGGRFMGPGDRARARIRRRRRQVFVVLIEATALSFIMGLFPPFRMMLGVTAFLIVALLVYASVLVKLRAQEMERAAVPLPRAANGSPNGNGQGHGGVVFDDAPSLDPIAESWEAAGFQMSDEAEQGVRLVDEDVHVVVYRSDEVDVRGLARSG